MKNRTVGLISGGLMILMASCGTPKDLTYFQEATPETVIRMVQEQPIRIKDGMKLTIVVNTKDPEVSALFNKPMYTTPLDVSAQSKRSGVANYYDMTPTTSGSLSVYTVDSKGNIDFPILGTLHVAGMTRAELAGYIKGDLVGRDLVKDAVVTVEFANAAISIVGNVMNPGRYMVSNDLVTITDAISMAGDVQLTGQHTNVKVFRKKDDGMHTYVVDLTSANKTMGSEAYYLQPGDVIYVEPDDIRKRSTRVNGNNLNSIGFWISIASLLASAATTVGVFVNK